MSAGSLSATEILDASADVVARIAAPWVGVLWLTALPLRMLQAHFAARLLELGGAAPRYGNYLSFLALATSAALIVSLVGRAVYVRASELGLAARESPGREALRLGAGGTASYLCAALLLEALFYALALTIVAVPLLVLLAGLAAATHTSLERPGLLRALRELARSLTHGRVLLALLGVFTLALCAAALNLLFLFRLGLWLAGAVPGFDPAPWDALLGPGSSRFLLALAVGAVLAVEPFWISALTVYVRQARSHQTGEDLRIWWARLEAERGGR